MQSSLMKSISFKKTESKLYQEFRKLQYLCFVLEQGWDIPSDHANQIVLESEYDNLSDYTLLKYGDEFIGGGKSTVCTKDFIPHKELYSPLIKNSFFKQNIEKVAVINGYCFKSTFRVEKDKVNKDERRRRLLRRIFLENLKSLDKILIQELFSLVHPLFFYQTLFFQIAL